MSEELSLRLDLLDRQVVDADKVPIGRVDDLLLCTDDGDGPFVEAIFIGAQALGERLGGPIGRTMARVAARLRPADQDEGPARISIQHVAGIEHELDLRVPFDELRHVAGLEHWLADHVIGPLPGSGDARE